VAVHQTVQPPVRECGREANLRHYHSSLRPRHYYQYSGHLRHVQGEVLPDAALKTDHQPVGVQHSDCRNDSGYGVEQASQQPEGLGPEQAVRPHFDVVLVCRGQLNRDHGISDVPPHASYHGR